MHYDKKYGWGYLVPGQQITDVDLELIKQDGGWKYFALQVTFFFIMIISIVINNIGSMLKSVK